MNQETAENKDEQDGDEWDEVEPESMVNEEEKYEMRSGDTDQENGMMEDEEEKNVMMSGDTDQRNGVESEFVDCEEEEKSMTVSGDTDQGYGVEPALLEDEEEVNAMMSGNTDPEIADLIRKYGLRKDPGQLSCVEEESQQDSHDYDYGQYWYEEEFVVSVNIDLDENHTMSAVCQTTLILNLNH